MNGGEPHLLICSMRPDVEDDSAELHRSLIQLPAEL